MQPTRRGQSLRVIASVALLMVAVASFGMWRVFGSSEELPYRTDAQVPSSSLVTQDAQYTLAVPGGVQAMLAHGVPVAAGSSGDQRISLQCTYTSDGQPGQTLAVSAESVSTKATNTVGSFVAPVGGRISVQCAGWGAMFIPDADDRPADNAGTALLVGVIALTIGACLGLGEMYRSWLRRQSAPPASAGGPGEDDEVEALVDVQRPLPYEREVADPDRDDVGQ